jgi:hypothetical protein
MPDPDHPLCPKTQASIEQDVDAWFSFYPLISGIFYDEVSTDQSKVAYYQNLYDYVQMKQAGAIVVNNFGVEPHPDYLTIGQSILCTFEGPFARFVGWQPPAWLPKDRSCALVYEVDDLTIAFKYLIKKPVGWFYFISDTLPNPWDILPSYFSDMVSMVCISLASAIIDGPVTGKPDTSYTFTAEISPSIATPPITYTWFPEPDSGQGTTSTTYIWSTVESKVITITATNIGGTVTDTHTICILCQPIYLPLISK